MVADVATLRSKRPDPKIDLPFDGAPEMWNLLEDGFPPTFGDDLHRLACHLTEKLGAAAHVLEDSANGTVMRVFAGGHQHKT